MGKEGYNPGESSNASQIPPELALLRRSLSPEFHRSQKFRVTNAAIASALAMDKEVRKNHSIRVTLVGPLDEQGELIKQPAGFIGAKIYVRFPTNDTQLVSSDDILLKKTHPTLTPEVLRAQADNIMPETPFDTFNRYFLNIKSIDMQNSAAASDARLRLAQETEETRQSKLIVISNFLQAADKLQEQARGLKPLFVVSNDRYDESTIDLQMWGVEEDTLIKRIGRGKALEQVFGDSEFVSYTKIDRTKLEADKRRFLEFQDTTAAPDHLRAAYDIITIFERDDIRRRTRPIIRIER